MEKYNTVANGVILGVIMPIIGFFISYPIKKMPLTTLKEYFFMAVQDNPNQQDILIFCLIPNMFMFYLTNFRWKTHNLTNGLIGATLVEVIILFFMVM